MTDIEKEIQNDQEEDFASLLENYEAGSLANISLGEKLEGKIVHKSKENLHINIGTRSEAILSLEDPRTENLKIDDTLTVYVKRAGGEIHLSLDPIIGHGDFSTLQEAHHEETPVEGTVIGVNKGGFEVNVAGIKCFCPISQLTRERIETPEKFIGDTREFKVIELDGRGKSAVISHRQLLIDEENIKRDELRSRIEPGITLPGRVVEIMKFGAFIDLGGLRGLLHISELAHYKVSRVEDVLHLDQELDVKILEMEKDERGRDRIRLSRKALIQNPWEIHHFEENQVIKGTPVRTAPFGIFVQIVEGIEGLIPKRFLKKDGLQVNLEEVELDQETELIVIESNTADQKLTLAFPGWDEKPESSIKPGEKVQAEIFKILPAGLLVQAKDDPARGLLPKRFLGKMTPKKLADTYPVGKELTVVVESIDEKGRYLFELLDKKNEVDHETIEKYSSPDSISQNPFADFFKK